MEHGSKSIARWISVEEMLDQIENEETEWASRGRVPASAIASGSPIRPDASRQVAAGSAAAGRRR